MFCSSCGKAITEEQSFCSSCGKPINAQSAQSKNSQNTTRQSLKIKADLVLRIAAGIALFSFLFMPQASCGGIKVSGIDILRLSGDTKSQDIILPIAVIAFALIAFIRPNSITGVFGLLSHLGILISAKLDKEVGEMIKVETGAFITAFGFIVIAFKQKIFQILGNNMNNIPEIKEENTGSKTKEELEEIENIKKREIEKREEAFGKELDKKADEDLLKY